MTSTDGRVAPPVLGSAKPRTQVLPSATVRSSIGTRTTFWIGVCVAIRLVVGTGDARASGPYTRLLASIREDPSFKVRMQAIRVLIKQIKASTAKPDDETLDGLSRASSADEEYLVRGLACFALGELADPRSQKALLAAVAQDPHPFVRVQAEEALKRMKVVEPSKETKRRLLIVALEDSPGVSPTPEVQEVLKSFLDEEFQTQAGDQFSLGNGIEGAGFRMNGSIAEMTIVPTEDGGKRVTIVVRITITTLPENYLRHVITAKASAVSRASGDGLANLEKKVLRAAVVRVVKDALAEVAVE